MIKTSHLAKSYGDFTVLKDISTDIQKGEIISIIGPSGTGKSTFLRCLNLLETPSGGSIFIDDIPLLEKTTAVPKLRQRMGMVFQSFKPKSNPFVKNMLCLKNCVAMSCFWLRKFWVYKRIFPILPLTSLIQRKMAL